METQRRFNALTPDEQTLALAAYDAAGAKAIAAGADAGRVADTLRRHTADLALNAEGKVVMLVETPEFRRRPAGFEYLPAWTASEMIVGGTGPEAVDGPRTMEAIAAHFYATNTEVRPMPLPDAVRLLASDESPSLFLTGQRAKLAELRAARRRELEVAAQMARQREEADARWRFENGDRQRAWEATAKPIQILHDALEPLPQYADLREALCASLAKYGDNVNRYVPMPASFRPDLLREAGRARGEPTSAQLRQLEPDAPPASTPAAEVS